jgi:hypothetical protein
MDEPPQAPLANLAEGQLCPFCSLSFASSKEIGDSSSARQAHIAACLESVLKKAKDPGLNSNHAIGNAYQAQASPSNDVDLGSLSGLSAFPPQNPHEGDEMGRQDREEPQPFHLNFNILI